jgi:hypothetical protein
MNINIIYDPPFFPIARYQRQDNIHKAESLDEKVGLSTDQGFKAMADRTIANAAAARVSGPPEGRKSGAILNIKI